MRSHFFQCFISLIAIVFVDQVTKWLAQTYLTNTTQYNSLGAGSVAWLGSSQLVWLWGSAGILFLLGFFAYKSMMHSPSTWFGWSLIIGGGLSNWLDRYLLGGVVDWLTIPGLGLKNNLADYALTAGVVWLVWQQLSIQSATKIK
jgi:lipoprotein signal peptidase